MLMDSLVFCRFGTCDQGPTLHWVGQGCRLQGLRDSGRSSLQCLLWMGRVVLSSEGWTQLTKRICMPVLPHGLLQFCHSPDTQLEKIKEDRWGQFGRQGLQLHFFFQIALVKHCVHRWRAGLLVTVSDVSFRLHVGLVTEALVNHLAVHFSSAAVSKKLLSCSRRRRNFNVCLHSNTWFV